MSNAPKSDLIKQINDKSVEERRNRQYLQLKAWDLGKITPLQCIEAIVNLEKIIFLGDQLKVIRRQ